MSTGTIVVLGICAVLGYIVVGFVIDKFFRPAPPADTTNEIDTLYAQSLGVAPGATMLELEQALARAIESYAPEHVAHMKEADQELAAIRLQQAHRAFEHLAARHRPNASS